jgi:phosphopantetheinyl transferase (holo-ACP synthase)
VIGIDIVDIRETHDARFGRKVLHEQESPANVRELWKLWAAKEAVYKAQQSIVPRPFSPKDIRVYDDRAEWGELTFGLHFWEGAHWVACAAIRGSGDSGQVWILRVSPADASESLRALIHPNVGYEIRRDAVGPPYAVQNGRRISDVVVSFSHDGEFAAAACLRKRNDSAMASGKITIEMICE